jgi:hypothetical protein
MGVEFRARELKVDAWTEALSLVSKLVGLLDWLTGMFRKRNLILVPRDFQPPFIGPVLLSVAIFPGTSQKRGIFVSFTFSVRNLATQPVRIVRSRFKIFRRHFGLVPVSAHVVDDRCRLKPDAEASVYGHHAVLPQAPAVQAAAERFVEPATAADGGSFCAKVCLVDDSGNEHWTKELTFRPLPHPAAPPVREAR